MTEQTEPPKSVMEQIARDIRQGTFPQKSQETLAEEIDKLREALAPFAAIGGLIQLGDIPDETVACYMRLDGLTALEFREAYRAFLATNPTT